ncbi:MAG: BolA family transcriptional regulator [Beijerinckiaceae bacterium]|nr:BolA family transcriptional regulator [Beijerinckiaceae bacterium]
MTMRETIAEKLQRLLDPAQLDVIDESHLHAGHSGARPGGETHFRVRCVSAAFAGKSRVERHRIVNAALADELASSVHALALELKATGEG